MNKKYLAVIALMLVVTALFAACKKYDEDRVLTDREENTHLLATDENGETMQDKDGNIIEVVTDAKGKEVTDDDGNQVTQAVTYPDILEADGYVENQYLKIKPEEDWKQTGALTIKMDNEKYGAQYVLDVEEGKTVEDLTAAYTGMVDQMKKTAAYKESDCSTEEIKLGGIKMTKLTITYTLDKKYVSEEDPESQIMYIYLHEKDGNTYNFQGTILPEHKDKVDFDKIMTMIEYK